MKISKQYILDLFAQHNYEVKYDDYPNIFGIRNCYEFTNKFDDVIGVFWGKNQIDNILYYPATTDPGLFFAKNPIDGKRTAVMVAGQYKNVYAVGKHKGKYTALRQIRPIDFYQDGNRDNKIDRTAPIKSQLIYANIHSTRDDMIITEVNKFSAACQVIQHWADFLEFMEIFINSKHKEFNYALFDKQIQRPEDYQFNKIM